VRGGRSVMRLTASIILDGRYQTNSSARIRLRVIEYGERTPEQMNILFTFESVWPHERPDCSPNERLSGDWQRTRRVSAYEQTAS